MAQRPTWPRYEHTEPRLSTGRVLHLCGSCMDCLKLLDNPTFSWYKMNDVHSQSGETMAEATQEGIQSKRQAIIEAAIDIFAKQGYEDTTTAQIAAEIGVAVGGA